MPLCLYNNLKKHMSTFLLGVCLAVELLDDMATLFNLLMNCYTFPK